MDQLVVCMFLFYSGYGIMESFKIKENYVNQLPKNRIFKTLFNFDFAVLIYMLLYVFFQHKEIGLKKVLLSFIGWESFGNSNWYIFSIFVLVYSNLFIIEIIQRY